MLFPIQSIGLAASHVLAGKIALNNMTSNATCQLVFSIVTMVISVVVSHESVLFRGYPPLMNRSLAIAFASTTFWQIVRPTV